jgi:hypothetical protein
LCQPCVKQVYRRHFSNSMCSFRVSVSHFDNCRNISNFFIVIISVMVICDLLCYYCNCFWALLSNSIAATEESFMKGRVNRFSKLHSCFILRYCHSHPNLQQLPPWSVSSHQHRGKTIHHQKITTRWKLRWWLSTL